MLRFKKIRWKNLLSYGNPITEFDLESNRTILFQGESGSGKSTLCSALCFALFGKPFASVKKNNIVNSINNGGLLTEIEFSSGTKNYRVVRGIKPNIFEIYENDVKLIINDTSVNDHQNYFETQILKFNMKSFLQICLLGSANFVPFMQLSAGDRRNLVDEILDIKSFTLMHEQVKDDIKRFKEEYSDLESERRLVEKEIHLRSQYVARDIDKINAQKKALEDFISNTTTKLSEIRGKISDVTSVYDALINKKIAVTSIISSLETDLIRKTDSYKSDLARLEAVNKNDISKNKENLSTELSRFKKQVDYFNSHDNCSVCLQEINSDHKHSILGDIQKSVAECNERYEKSVAECNERYEKSVAECNAKNKEAIKELGDKLNKLKTADAYAKLLLDIADREGEKTSLKNEEVELKIKLDSFKKELKGLDKDDQPAIDTEKIQESKTKLASIELEFKSIAEKQYIAEIASGLLKDDGIKTDIIREYLPVINTLVNTYLDKMNFFVEFKFDESFNESIKVRGRDEFEYNCFSEGQKQRLDLALLFTWRHIAKAKNSLNTNLLVLDEIADSKLNNEAAESVWDILKSAEFNDSNVFVISHKNTILDKFEKVYNFSMNGNFSQVKEMD